MALPEHACLVLLYVLTDTLGLVRNSGLSMPGLICMPMPCSASHIWLHEEA